jgi:subtilase family serine protease
MKERGRYFLYLLSTVIVMGMIVLGAVLGTAILHPTQKVGAAPISAKKISKMSELTAVLPMEPMWDQKVNMATTQALPACLTNAALPLCYSPQQMRQAYGVQPLLDAGTTGKGRTITLVEAFQDPTIQTDLQQFDSTFGLPAPQTEGFDTFW